MGTDLVARGRRVGRARHKCSFSFPFLFWWEERDDGPSFCQAVNGDK